MRRLLMTVICVLASTAHTRPSPERHKRQYAPSPNQYPPVPGLGPPNVPIQQQLPPQQQQLPPQQQQFRPQQQHQLLPQQQPLLPPQQYHQQQPHQGQQPYYDNVHQFNDPNLFNPRGPGPIQHLSPLDQNVPPWEPMYPGPPLGRMPHNTMPAPNVVGSKTAQQIMHMGTGPEMASGRYPQLRQEPVGLRTFTPTERPYTGNASVESVTLDPNTTIITQDMHVTGNSPGLRIPENANHNPAYTNTNSQVQQIANQYPSSGPYQPSQTSEVGGPRINSQGSYYNQPMTQPEQLPKRPADVGPVPIRPPIWLNNPPVMQQPPTGPNNPHAMQSPPALNNPHLVQPPPGPNNPYVAYDPPGPGNPQAMFPQPGPGNPQSMFPQPGPGNPQSMFPQPGSGNPQAMIPQPGSGNPQAMFPQPGPGNPQAMFPQPGPGNPQAMFPQPGLGNPQAMFPQPGPGNPQAMFPQLGPGNPQAMFPQLGPGNASPMAFPPQRPNSYQFMRPPPGLGNRHMARPGGPHVNPFMYNDPAYAMDPYTSSTYQDPYYYVPQREIFYPGMDPYGPYMYYGPPQPDYVAECLFHNATESTTLPLVKFGPVEDNCHKYVLCNYTESEWGEALDPEVLTCDFGFWFDPGLQMCVDIDNTPIPCEFDPCLTNNLTVNIMEEYPGHCDAFYACEGTAVTIELCDMLQYFDPIIKACLPNNLTHSCIAKVLIVPTTTTATPTLPTGGYHGYPPGWFPRRPPMPMPYYGNPYFTAMPHLGQYAQSRAPPYGMVPPPRSVGPGPPRHRQMRPYNGPTVTGGQPRPRNAAYGYPPGVYGQPGARPYNPQRFYYQTPLSGIPTMVYKRSSIQQPPTPTSPSDGSTITTAVNITTTMGPTIDPRTIDMREATSCLGPPDNCTILGTNFVWEGDMCGCVDRISGTPSWFL